MSDFVTIDYVIRKHRDDNTIEGTNINHSDVSRQWLLKFMKKYDYFMMRKIKNKWHFSKSSIDNFNFNNVKGDKGILNHEYLFKIGRGVINE